MSEVKPDIKIFVSHRIDQDSETIDNPLFVNVRCGAVYDTRENVSMLGDDTGDNISEKRESFCELTVQYWAWKNVKADYYGLCHYRRYLSFAENHKKDNIDDRNIICESVINEEFVKKHNLNKAYMANVIKKHDILCIEPMDLKKTLKKKISVYDSLKMNEITFNISGVDLFISIFKKKYPEYSEDIDSYFNDHFWMGYNCYVMNSQIFNEYCSALYDVLFELEKKLNTENFNQEQYRLAGYMGECFLGIFVNHARRTKKYNIKSLPLIQIENTIKEKDLMPAFTFNNIPVIMASSNEYAPFLSVLIQSIVDNSSLENNYDIIVLSNNISKYNKQLIFREYTRPNVSVRFFDISSLLATRNFYTRLHVTPMTYVRLAALDILNNFDKAIYFDCDVVVNSDVSELYTIDLNNFFLAAARDTVMSGWCNMPGHHQINYNRDKLKLDNIFNYFNAGVLVLNLKELRDEFDCEYLLDFAESQKWLWFDQDVLNSLCKNKVRFLDPKWNVMTHVFDVPQQLTEYYAPKEVYNQYLSALEQPKAVHFAGRVIPCFAPNVKLAEIFWYYARKTPYYEYILSSMVYDMSYNVTRKKNWAAKIIGKMFPVGSKSRGIVKTIFPYNSFRRKVLEKFLYLFVV